MPRLAYAALSVALLTACQSGPTGTSSAAPTVKPTPVGRTVTVTLSVTGPDVQVTTTHDATGDHTSACVLPPGFSDVPSTEVTVKDETGKIVGAGQMAFGPKYSGPGCTSGTSIGPLPDAPFYQLDLGRRGQFTYSKADLEAKDWKVALTLAQP